MQTNTLQVAALAGLTGLFSSQASLKLKDLVDAIFTTRSDPRSAKLTQKSAPTITTVLPPTFDHANPPTELTINGTDFVSGCTVKINGSSKPATYVTSTKLTVGLAGSSFSMGKLKVVVINPNGDVSTEYEVSVT
jgi:hypothetical protein